MGAVPTIATWSPGVLTTAHLNSIKAAVDFLQSPPQCSAYHSTLSSLTSGTTTVIPLQSEFYDVVQSGDSPMHDNSTNNSRIVARTAGKYEISGQLGFASNATGVRSAVIKINAAGNPASGTSVMSPQVAALSSATTVVAIPVKTVQLAVGDYIEMFGLQTSGGALNTAPGTGGDTTFLQMKWVGI